MDTEEAARNVGGQNVVDEILQDVVIPTCQTQQDRQPGTSGGVEREDLPDVSSKKRNLLKQKYSVQIICFFHSQNK